MAPTNALHWADYLTFCCILVLTLGLGLVPALRARDHNSVQGFLMGNFKLSLVPVTMSMLMSWSSGIMLLGDTAEMYTHGTHQLMVILGDAVGYVILALVIVPVLYPLRLISAFQYYEMRYKSKALRRVLSFINIIDNAFYSGLALFAPSVALQAVTGFPVWVFVVTGGLIATIYSAVGGMKAIVWTDCFQILVFYGGILATLVIGVQKLGGLDDVWRISKENGRVSFFNVSLSPRARTTVWNTLMNRLFYSYASLGAGQTLLQRYTALPSVKHAQWSVLMTIPLILVLNALLLLVGLTMFSYYHESGCDPLRAGDITSSNQLLPYFVASVIRIPGFSGLIIAVLFSGALSTIDSALSSVSANLWKDFLEPCFKHKKEQTKALVNRIIVFVFGWVSIGFAVLIQILPGHLQVVSRAVLGSSAAAMSGPFILGLFFPFGSAKGAISGVVVSAAFMTWVNIGQFWADPFREKLPTDVTNCTLPINTTLPPLPQDPLDVFPLYALSFNWFALMSFALSLGVGVISSIIFGCQNAEDVDQQLIVPLANKIWHRFQPHRNVIQLTGLIHKEECKPEVDHGGMTQNDGLDGIHMNDGGEHSNIKL